VVRLLTTQVDDLSARVGRRLELVGVADRNLEAVVAQGVDPALVTDDSVGLVTRADIVVELIGGTEPARGLMLAAMASGASVVTANKALLAADGPTLYDAAAAAGVDLYYEAAVAGAIPVVRVLREGMLGDQVRRVLGIVNGTTNYVLDTMTTDQVGLDRAVKDAQRLGYAEADPTADVEGHDAAAKAALLASMAFHTRVSIDDVSCEGITALTDDDVAWAQRTGHVVKLLAVAERLGGPDGSSGGGGISVRVHPALVPQTHPLAGVRGAFNAVFIEAEAAGPIMLYGQGAGGVPTSSAVVSDVVAAARNRVTGGRGPLESAYAALPVLPASAAVSRFQVRMDVADRTGVLATVSAALADAGVSIESVRQSPGGAVRQEAPVDVAHLVITTHAATEAARVATIAALDRLDVVYQVVSVIRVEGDVS
jgi:homoserine dehydrogenase